MLRKLATLALLTVVQLLPVAALRSPVVHAASGMDPAIGPHARAELAYAGRHFSFAPASSSPIPLRAARTGATAGPATAAVAQGALQRQVLGFAPYWELSTNSNWNYSLLSTVAYFGINVNGDGSFVQTDSGWAGWNSQDLVNIITAAHNAGDRVVLVVKQSNDAAITQLGTDAPSTQNAINNIVAAITSKSLDGVNVDFEGNNNDGTEQPAFTSFVRQLSSAMHQHGWTISVDTYGGAASWDGGIFKIGDLAPLVDALFIMAYDTAFDNTPGYAGPNAPLNGWTYNDTTDVTQYLTKAPASKILLGVPYYGLKWSTTDSASGPANGPYAKVTGGESNPTYSQVLGDVSCNAQQRTFGWDATAQSPWTSWYSPATNDPCGGNFGSWREMYYDNADSLGLKYDLVNNQNLLGTGVWALGFDGSSPDLWNELSLKFVVKWDRIGGYLTSGAAVASWTSGRLDAFVRGGDNGLYHISYQNGAWSGWDFLGGTLTSAPAAVSWGPGRIDVFVRGPDSALWHRAYQNSSWTAWENLGGYLTSGPAVASWASGRLDVFARGPYNGLWHKSFDGTTWSGWDYLGGTLTSGPAAVSWGTGRIDTFVAGPDRGLWHKSYHDGGWSAWDSLGGYLTSGPAASSWAANRLDVFVRGPGNAAYHKAFDGTGWSMWQSLGGSLTADPAAVSWGPGRIDVFVRGPDFSLWHMGINLQV